MSYPKGRVTLGLVAAISSVAMAATVGVGVASAKSAQKTSFTPSAKVVGPAKKLGNTVLNVGDQAGTGAEAVLEAAGLIKSTGSSTGVLKDGLKVSWADFTAGPPILQAIAGGSLDIGGVGDAPPVFADPASKEVIVGALKGSSNNAALLVPKNSGITSVSQLQGKSVAVGTGTSADYHFLTVVQKAGLKPSDFNVQSLTAAAGLQALESGNVAAFDTWSPWVEDAEEAGFVDIASSKSYGIPYSYQVASEAALTSPAKVLAIRDYLTELYKAYTWVTSHPVVWAKSWASVTALPLNVMKSATLDDPSKPIPVTPAIVQAEQGVVNGFAASGEIPAKFNISPFVTDAFAGAVTGNWTTATSQTKSKRKK